MLTACTANYLTNMTANGVRRDILQFTKAILAFKISHYFTVKSFTILRTAALPSADFHATHKRSTGL